MIINNLETALRALHHAGRDSLGLLLDTLHFCRSGGSAEDLAKLDPTRISYVQICDARMETAGEDYMASAMDRLAPGEGDLPLRDILAAVPPGTIVSAEVPQRALALSGIGPHERARRCIAAIRRLLEPTD